MRQVGYHSVSWWTHVIKHLQAAKQYLTQLRWQIAPLSLARDTRSEEQIMDALLMCLKHNCVRVNTIQRIQQLIIKLCTILRFIYVRQWSYAQEWYKSVWKWPARRSRAAPVVKPEPNGKMPVFHVSMATCQMYGNGTNSISWLHFPTLLRHSWADSTAWPRTWAWRGFTLEASNEHKSFVIIHNHWDSFIRIQCQCSPLISGGK